MRTSFFKQRIFKSNILFFTITAFLLSAFLFASCSDSESMDNLEINSSVLIEKIESASKVVISASSLPAQTETAFRGDLADSYVLSAEFAKGFGYKVSIATDNESREEVKSDVYFSLQGKQLADTNEKRRKRRNKCFEFVYPLDLMMPDNTTITLTSKEDWSLKKDWYVANPDVTERPELIFPFDVTLEDGTVQTLIDRDELKAVKNSCKKGKDKRKCFKLVLPVSFTMEDASIIEVTKRADFRLLREWRKANPDATAKPALNFPLDIQYKDGTAATINNQTEFDAAKDACKN
ncbi:MULTISPECIES: hypothetical protein [unclassified Polaribacter]|jgi:hypothetical protein|uniref:hypothetical protein n=1 Tax=unclassified Polaribacter TaxID=196858 RepID=UPI00052C00AF|nr:MULTISPECIES: hypothetical protein [unclassified Polaribacter]KGL59723.1 hypothetical protein PHEL49_0584 [Polaribacter sp. Hel1_33_49]PKV64217.1 hypothetical protein ATE90_0597 [Polaribacter sp. Hel1_33_96]